MSNSDNQPEPSDAPASEQRGQSNSLGEVLLAAREAKKLSVREAAEALKISADYVRALESDRYDLLPCTTFVKGYLKFYARLLSLDEDEVFRLFAALAINIETEEKKTSHDASVHRRRKGARSVVVCLVLALLLFFLSVGFAGFHLWRGQLVDEMTDTDFMVMGTEALPVDEASNEFADRLSEISRASEPDSELEADVESESQNDPVADLEKVTLESPVVTVDLVEPSRQTEGVAVQDQLVIQFRADCWVEVYDIDRSVLYADLEQAKTELKLKLSGPVNILFGDVFAVKAVYYKGEPVALDFAESGQKVGRLRLG